jgi:predicted TIM-barrel fold metal-dependent hydrolase
MVGGDHHTHICSPAAAEHILPAAKEQGVEVPPGTAAELVRLLDRDGVDRALVLSVAYFFGMPDLGDADPSALAAENDWVADQVAPFADRLAACCSVNPALAGATAEIERCAATGRFVGLKLHVANSDLDLRDPFHLERLGEVFECANAAGLMIAIHMRGRRPDYGAPDVRLLIERLLPKAPDVAVQVAHAAGWGDYHQPCDAGLATFAAWAESDRSAAQQVYFDLSATVIDPPAGSPERRTGTGEERREAWRERRFGDLARHLRAIGLERVLFATDWPVATPAGYLQTLEERLPLEPGDFERLCANVAPWLARKGAPG